MKTRGRSTSTFLIAVMTAFVSVTVCTNDTDLMESTEFIETADIEVTENTSNESNEKNETTAPTSFVKSEKPKLVVYIDGYSNTEDIIVKRFIADHPEIEVTTVDYSEYGIDAFNQVVEGNMRGGGGPDVVLVNNSSVSTFKNITQMVKDGLILDVNTIGVDLSGCNSTVMKGGQFEGGQYLVPTNYSLGLMYTTKERLEISIIEYEEGMTLAEFAAQLPEFYEKNPYTKIFPNYLTSYFFCMQNALDLIDYENGTMKTDESSLAALEAMTDAFDGLFPGIFEDALPYMVYRNNKDMSDAELYHEDMLLFASTRSFTGAYDNLQMIANALYAEDIMKGETPMLINLPTLDGKAPAPVMTYYLMANANTENKGAVKAFIEYVVSEETQLDMSGCGIPVNNDALAQIANCFGDERSQWGDEYGLWKKCTLDAEFIESYLERIENMRDPIWNDYAVLNNLTGVMRAHSYDGLPIDEALALEMEELEFLIAK